MKLVITIFILCLSIQSAIADSYRIIIPMIDQEFKSVLKAGDVQSGDCSGTISDICDETQTEGAEDNQETPEDNANEWIAFFNDPANCTISGGPLETDLDLYNRSATVSCNNKGFTDNDLPQGGLFENNLSLQFYNNNLETLSSFSDLTNTYSLQLQTNNISSLANLNNLKSVVATFILADTDIENFIGLGSLETIGGLQVQNTVNLTSFEGLENVFSIGTLKIRKAINLIDISHLANVNINTIDLDEYQLDQFIIKAPANSRLCKKLESRDTRLVVHNSSGSGYVYDMNHKLCE